MQIFEATAGARTRTAAQKSKKSKDETPGAPAQFAQALADAHARAEMPKRPETDEKAVARESTQAVTHESAGASWRVVKQDATPARMAPDHRVEAQKAPEKADEPAPADAPEDPDTTEKAAERPTEPAGAQATTPTDGPETTNETAPAAKADEKPAAGPVDTPSAITLPADAANTAEIPATAPAPAESPISAALGETRSGALAGAATKKSSGPFADPKKAMPKKDDVPETAPATDATARVEETVRRDFDANAGEGEPKKEDLLKATTVEAPAAESKGPAAGFDAALQAAGGGKASGGATNAPAATAPNGAPALPPDIDKLMRDASVQVRPGMSRLVLAVDPPEYGKLDLKFVLKRGRLVGEITTTSAAVAERLQTDLARWRSMFDGSGVHVDELHVKTSDAGADQRGQGNAGNDPEAFFSRPFRSAAGETPRTETNDRRIPSAVPGRGRLDLVV